jgi:hypothetical protein
MIHGQQNIKSSTLSFIPHYLNQKNVAISFVHYFGADLSQLAVFQGGLNSVALNFM